MGTFVVTGKKYTGDINNVTNGPAGIPAPGSSETNIGVAIGKNGDEIIVVFPGNKTIPKPTPLQEALVIKNPGMYNPFSSLSITSGPGVDSGSTITNEDDPNSTYLAPGGTLSLSSATSVSAYTAPGGNIVVENGVDLTSFTSVYQGNVNLPRIAIDASSQPGPVQPGTSNPFESEPDDSETNDNNENANPLVVDFIDDDSISLAEARARDCDPIFFNLDFESRLSISDNYYNPLASLDAISGGTEPLPSTSTQDEEDEDSRNTTVEVDISWAESVAGEIDKIISLDKNVKLEDVGKYRDAKWQLGNTNALDDALTSVLSSQREIDFGFFITESNFKDYAQIVGVPDSEDIARPYDIDSIFNIGLPSSIIGYNRNVDNENDVISLELIDIVDSSPGNKQSANMFAEFF